MGRNMRRVTPELTRQITARFEEVKTQYPSYGLGTIFRKLGREFNLSPTTIKRHAYGVENAQKELAAAKANYGRKHAKRRPQPAARVSVNGQDAPEVRVQRKLMRLAANPDTDGDEIRILVELAHLLTQPTA